MTPTLEFEEFWPQWPREASGWLLLDLCVETSFSELVHQMWSPNSRFLAEVNRQRGYVDFHCTDWMSSETELPDLPGGFDWRWEHSPTAHFITNVRGKMRKVRFEARSGTVLTQQPFKTEEVQRCIQYKERECMVVDACVRSTAPLCDKIRVLCRYTITAVKPKKCQLRVVYHIEYLQSLNGFLKGILERGARDGLTSNYDTYAKVLLSCVSSTSEKTIADSAPKSQSDLDLLQSSAKNMRSYQSVLNWSAVPPISFIFALRNILTTRSLLMWFFELVVEFSVAVLYIAFLYLLFYLWTLIREVFDTGSLFLLPDMDFRQGLATVFVLILLLEGSQIFVHFFKRLLNISRLCCIHLYGKMSAFLARLHAESHRNLHSSPSIDDTVSLAEHLTDDERIDHGCSAETDDVEGDQDDSFVQKIVNGFWTLLSYNSSDFRKFAHSVPVEERTNPDGSVVEELFENERLQPFRGWGHQWPGHFLPTDKFSHWSSFDIDGNIVTCDQRDKVEPWLPPGWEWKEEDWEVDLSKMNTQAVDKQGWYYSLDFPWIKFTPEKNNGIRKMSDFVRRRRYTRTRVRKTQAPNAKAQVSAFQDNPRNRTPYFSFLQFL